MLWKVVLFQLLYITKPKLSLSFNDLKMVTNFLLDSSLLDKCNSVHLGICPSPLSHLQLVQDATAKLQTDIRRWESITPVLASLYWLRVDYRLYYLFFKLYMAWLLCPSLPPESLGVRLRGKSNHAFTVAAQSSGITHHFQSNAPHFVDL